MLGAYAQHAQTYLLVLMTSTTLFFALPIFLTPLTWARLMMWRVPEDTDLAVYFGRCLGAFILIVEFLMLRGAMGDGLAGNGVAYAFDVLFGVFGLMLAIHIYGAVRRIQPITETLEIGFWAVLLLLNTVFYPASSITPL